MSELFTIILITVVLFILGIILCYELFQEKEDKEVVNFDEIEFTEVKTEEKTELYVDNEKCATVSVPVVTSAPARTEEVVLDKTENKFVDDGKLHHEPKKAVKKAVKKNPPKKRGK